MLLLGVRRRRALYVWHARATLVQLFGGVTLILTFVATWLQISDASEASEQTLRLS